jgi:hypothetical protein
MHLRAKTPEGRRLEAAARESISQLSDEKLTTTWLITETMPVTEELAMTRGWLMDELEGRMNVLDNRDAVSPYSLGQTVSRFDRWLWTDGDTVDPTPYLR